MGGRNEPGRESERMRPSHKPQTRRTSFVPASRWPSSVRLATAIATFNRAKRPLHSDGGRANVTRTRPGATRVPFARAARAKRALDRDPGRANVTRTRPGAARVTFARAGRVFVTGVGSQCTRVTFPPDAAIRPRMSAHVREFAGRQRASPASPPSGFEQLHANIHRSSRAALTSQHGFADGGLERAAARWSAVGFVIEGSLSPGGWRSRSGVQLNPPQPR